MDLSYQAIPHASPALERARRDGLFGSELEFWSSYATPDARHDAMAQRAQDSGEEHDRAFVEAVALARQSAREHPGLELRGWDWSRGYVAVHYLLSPARRLHGGKWDLVPDWAGEAIYGVQVLHPDAVTTIGFKIRYTPPHLVREHAEIIGAATRDDLREHFDAEKMSGRVYKYFGDPDGFEDWMWPQFEEWRDFLLSMLDFPDEGLLCSIG